MHFLPFFSLLALCIWTVASDALQPRTITLTKRKAARQARRIPVRALANSSQSISEPLQDQFNGTDLEWFGEIGFGTPSQTFQVVFDTGSFDIEIPGVQCGALCANQHTFDSTKSSTFVNTTRSNTLQFITGGGVEPSDFESLQVLQVVDTMTLLGISVPNTTFFLITNQTTGFVNDPYDGIVGLGYQPNAGIFAALKQHGLPALYSMSLTSHTIGNAELTLGGIDSSKTNGSDPIWAPILPPTNQTNFWSLNVTQISVNGQAIKQDLFSNVSMEFDSGTSNVVMPTNLTTAMYALISSSIKPFGTLGAFGIPCSEISNLPAEITFTFMSSSGTPFNLTIPSEELNVGPLKEDSNTCQTLINALDGFGAIIGGSLLKHYYSVWDVDNARLGFVGNGTCGSAVCGTPKASHGRRSVLDLCLPIYAMLCLASLMI